ncbi:MAG: phage terminase small subunit P27 family [Planctomycetes bacterium]|nr:phage terminase small subunit P27 family [Planctomycetota bacterium]
MKQNRGTFRPHRSKGEPPAMPGTPQPPDWLGEDARREWRRIVPLLAARGLLELTDRAALTGYCSAWGDLAQATRTLAEEGTTTIGPKGQLQSHPELRRLETARQALRQFAQEFGLSPSSRSRVHAGPAADPVGDARRKRFAAVQAMSPEQRTAAKNRFFGGAS